MQEVDERAASDVETMSVDAIIGKFSSKRSETGTAAAKLSWLKAGKSLDGLNVHVP